LRKEIAPHLRFLQKQVEKLEKTESLREELLNVSKEYFKREESYLSETKKHLEVEQAPLNEALRKLDTELAEAKKILAEAGQKEKKEYLILELEKELSGARVVKDTAGRELGKAEGLISAQEGLIKRQEELAASDEHKVIPLKEVENLYREIEAEKSDLDHLRSLLEHAKSHDGRVLDERISYSVKAKMERLINHLAAEPADAERLAALEQFAETIMPVDLGLNLWKVQDVYWDLLQKVAPRFHESAAAGDAKAREWTNQFAALGEKLGFAVQDLKVEAPKDVAMAA
jgi:hypothetical protein